MGHVRVAGRHDVIEQVDIGVIIHGASQSDTETKQRTRPRPLKKKGAVNGSSMILRLLLRFEMLIERKLESSLVQPILGLR